MAPQLLNAFITAPRLTGKFSAEKDIIVILHVKQKLLRISCLIGVFVVIEMFLLHIPLDRDVELTRENILRKIHAGTSMSTTRLIMQLNGFTFPPHDEQNFVQLKDDLAWEYKLNGYLYCENLYPHSGSGWKVALIYDNDKLADVIVSYSESSF